MHSGEVFVGAGAGVAGQPLSDAFRVVHEYEPLIVCRPVCDREQLGGIIQRAALPNVTVQVVPYDIGIHSDLYSNFFVLSFPHAAEPDPAYVEYGFGSLQIEKKTEVRAARMMFEHLADLALDEPDSLALLRRVSDEAEANEASSDARAARDRHRLA